jgi:hypothetical protein
MEMQPVQSECLSSVGYDPASQTLRLEFRNGGTHDYDGVPPAEHAALLSAGSLGRHFQRHIRKQFASRKVA